LVVPVGSRVENDSSRINSDRKSQFSLFSDHPQDIEIAMDSHVDRITGSCGPQIAQEIHNCATRCWNSGATCC
jgi:hypothetical protein